MSPSLVQSVFNLTDAEADLAIVLCAGKTLDDIAVDRGTSINTVKSQMKSIYYKTGTNRQTELVSTLLTSSAYFLTERA